MALFTDLVCVKGGELEGPADVRTVTQAIRELKLHRVVSGAGDGGAFTVWLDDHGCYQMSFQRHQVELSRLFSRTKGGMVWWLKKWLPKCQMH